MTTVTCPDSTIIYGGTATPVPLTSNVIPANASYLEVGYLSASTPQTCAGYGSANVAGYAQYPGGGNSFALSLSCPCISYIYAQGIPNYTPYTGNLALLQSSNVAFVSGVSTPTTAPLIDPTEIPIILNFFYTILPLILILAAITIVASKVILKGRKTVQ